MGLNFIMFLINLLSLNLERVEQGQMGAELLKCTCSISEEHYDLNLPGGTKERAVGARTASITF